MEYLKGLLFMLIIAEIIISGYLAVTSLAGIEPICITGQNCKIVQNSQYSSIFGIPLSILGTIAFIILLMTYYLAYKDRINYNWFLGLCILGLISALYFLYIQFFVIKALCSNCLVVDFGMILIFIISLLINKRTIK